MLVDLVKQRYSMKKCVSKNNFFIEQVSKSKNNKPTIWKNVSRQNLLFFFYDLNSVSLDQGSKWKFSITVTLNRKIFLPKKKDIRVSKSGNKRYSMKKYN